MLLRDYFDGRTWTCAGGVVQIRQAKIMAELMGKNADATILGRDRVVANLEAWLSDLGAALASRGSISF